MYGLYTCIVVITSIFTGLYAHDRDAASSQERVENFSPLERNLRRRVRLIFGPWELFKTMMVDPLSSLDSKSLQATYQIDMANNFNFFLVTVSRLFYYCGVSSKSTSSLNKIR
jgi:hypothetical protein